MELKTGYRQTDLGPLPCEWSIKPLGRMGEALIGLTYAPSDVRRYGTLVLRSSNIQNDALAFEDNVFVDMEIPERLMVRSGDLLICVRNGSRPLIGKTALLDERTVGMTFGAFMAVFRSEYGQYVNYLFRSHIIKRQIDEHLGATINQITNKSLKSFQIPVPPTDDEIDAIGTALSDVDALLEGLDRLIAKRRDLKQAAMQQLLTGETRLPGFEDGWRLVKFSDLTSPSHSRIDPSRSEPCSFCVELEHIEQGTGRLLGWSSTTPQSSIKATFGPGDVLFSKLRAYLRKYWLATRPGVCSTEIWVLKPNPDAVTSGYLYQLVTTSWFIEAASLAYGTHMPRSDWKVVRELELQVPSPPEQEAIAQVLGDMDTAIEALEQRRAKTADLKQAMMQELLTGKTRLVTPQILEATDA